MRRVRASVTAPARMLRGEDGIALIMAVLVLAVMTIVGTAVVQYTGSNSRTASLSKESQSAYGLAEGGIAEAMAVISKSGNNPFNPYLLPTRTASSSGGTTTWSGAFNPSTSTWTITSDGYRDNPTGATSDVHRRVTATVLVEPVLASGINNPLWNYIYSKRTGDPDGCDMEIRNSSDVQAPVYVEGNLCVGQTTRLRDTVIVKGTLTLENPQNSIGISGSPVPEVHIGNGCQYTNNPYHNPCLGAADNVYASVLDTTPPSVTPPTIYWDAWYLNASPGPYYACTTSTGTPPVFDNDQGSPSAPNAAKRNTSIPGSVDLAPSSSYSCVTPNGELSWNNATKTLTVEGTVFIDGSAYIQNNATNQYDGQGVLYLSGTFLLKNSTLCAAVSGSNCISSASWDVNNELLIVVAGGNGDGVPVGDSTQVFAGDSILLQSGTLQGGLMAEYVIDARTTSDSDGPLLGDTIIIGQTVDNYFPTITMIPSGAPGNQTVTATIHPPKVYG